MLDPILTYPPLALLWFLWAALLFGGFALGTPHEDGSRRMPLATRLASSGALTLAAWLAVALGLAEGAALPLLALGMTLGLVGDLFMAGVLGLTGQRRIAGGMGAFGLGHLAYIAGLLVVARGQALAWAAWVGWLGIGAAGWWLVVQRGQPATPLHRAALPYALLLASTAGLATALALGQPAFAPIALGATLFLMSDLLLAAQLFNGLHFPLISDGVWLLYGPGQMLIVYGAIVALAR